MGRETNFARAHLVQDVFGEWVERTEEAYVPPPARQIPVTEEIRREDAELRAARERREASGWEAVKATLSVANLGKARGGKAARQKTVRKVQLVRERPEPVPAVKVAEPVRVPRRMCGAGCGRRLIAASVGETCSLCRRAAMPKPPKRMCGKSCGRAVGPRRRSAFCSRCAQSEERANQRAALRPLCAAGCGRRVRQGSRQRPDGLCAWCGQAKRKAARKQARAACANGCGRRLYRGNPDGVCSDCRPGLQGGYQVRLPRQVCVGEGCGRLLRRGKAKRPDGMCGVCGAAAESKARGRKGVHARLVALHGDTCANCRKKIKRGTRTGLCAPCACSARKRCTQLQAESVEEFEADRMWARLSPAEKRMVMEGRGGRVERRMCGGGVEAQQSR